MVTRHVWVKGIVACFETKRTILHGSYLPNKHTFAIIYTDIIGREWSMVGSKTKRVYIAIDLKSFYASVECVDRKLDPLTTNLVVADVSRTEKLFVWRCHRH